VREVELPLPPGPMPLRRGARPLKRWRYVGVFSDEVMICAADVRVGPLAQRFWAVAERGRPLVERTTTRAAGLRLDGSRVRVDAGEVRIDLALDEGAGVESIHPSGRRGYVWTRKQAGIPARGEVRIGSRAYSLDALAVVDDTAGYHERRTRWTWSAGVGRGTRGERVGWNLMAGVNDSERASERSIWVGGEPSEPPPVTFSGDLSRIAFAGGEELRFTEWCAREDRTNLLLVRSTYRQPFGTFTGSLPGGVRLAEGQGVVESHDAVW
jgi:hypothetical protein